MRSATEPRKRSGSGCYPGSSAAGTPVLLEEPCFLASPAVLQASHGAECGASYLAGSGGRIRANWAFC